VSMSTTKEAVIFGAGNVGRGFLGQLFCESGYRVTFIDLDRPLLEALNLRGEYKLRLVTNDSCDELTVGPVGAVYAGDLDLVAEAIGRAEIGATAVGANVLKHIAPAVAAGVRRRAELGNTQPLNLIVCENLKGAAAIFRDLVRDVLASDERAFLDEQVGFVDTVIARMVPAPTPEMRAQDASMIVVEPYKELPVDAAGFIGEPPQIAGMGPYSPFSFFTERKLYIHNAGHALLAYLGYLGGYEYGYQALADEDIYYQARGAMEESARALVRKYRPPTGALLANIDDLLRRFANRALGDSVLRLGRDPLRKLGRTDRVVGAALNALTVDVIPTNLVTGIAAALHFDSRADPLAQELQAKLRSRGLAATLAEVCGLAADEPLFEMVMERYGRMGERRREVW
jgi:mannitol-1-phosphate 5-dehydrogenase